MAYEVVLLEETAPGSWSHARRSRGDARVYLASADDQAGNAACESYSENRY